MIPDLSVLWVIVLVLALTFIVQRFLFGPLLHVMHERESATAKAQALAAEAGRRAQAATADYEAQMSAARNEVYRQMETGAPRRAGSQRRVRRPGPPGRRRDPGRRPAIARRLRRGGTHDAGDRCRGPQPRDRRPRPRTSGVLAVLVPHHMASSSLRLCETFLKRSWHRAATVFAALIALSGVPVEDAQARTAARSVQAPPRTRPLRRQAQPKAQPDASHAAQPAASQPVESTQPPPRTGSAAPHGARPRRSRRARRGPGAGTGDAAHGQPPAHGPPAAGAHGAEAAGHDGRGRPPTRASGPPSPASSISPSSSAASSICCGRPWPSISPAAHSRFAAASRRRARPAATATAQLAEIDRRLQTLPAELEALRAEGRRGDRRRGAPHPGQRGGRAEAPHRGDAA